MTPESKVRARMPPGAVPRLWQSRCTGSPAPLYGSNKKSSPSGSVPRNTYWTPSVARALTFIESPEGFSGWPLLLETPQCGGPR